jgi:AcrR family transcriptional regulator
MRGKKDPAGARGTNPVAGEAKARGVAGGADKGAAADGKATAAPKKERHYRRARRDRGAETRQRLIEAALDVFGRYGFDGASTRQIAREADANLAAIVYHFGSKEALQIAVAEYLVGRVASLIAPALGVAGSPETSASPEAARAALVRLLETYADVLLGEAEAERWARFIVREQMQPTAAFEVIYGMMGGAMTIAVRLVAAVLGRDPEDEAVRLCAITLMGQVLVFRVAHSLVLRRMGWPAIGERERAAIKRVVVADVHAILDHVVLP